MTRFPFAVAERLCLVCLAILVCGPSALAQNEEDELQIPDPETVTVETKDGVLIRCTYYPGGFVEKAEAVAEKPKVEKKSGKETVPIIMLHGWEGKRAEFDGLATMLQKLGHAVMVPDLRGHGDSTTRKLRNGDEMEIDRDRMRSTDIAAMLADVEAVKKFLKAKNNAGELNIEMLCVIGADVGGTVAVNWAAYDWSKQQLPAFKQGRDVKALVLLSPRQSFKGYSLSNSLKLDVVRKGLSIMLVAGSRDRTGARDAKAIFARLEKFHEVPANAEDRLKKQDLFYLTPNTNLSGTRLLQVRGLTVSQAIAKFIDLRLVRKSEDYPWMERKNPLGG